MIVYYFDQEHYDISTNKKPLVQKSWTAVN